MLAFGSRDASGEGNGAFDGLHCIEKYHKMKFKRRKSNVRRTGIGHNGEGDGDQAKRQQQNQGHHGTMRHRSLISFNNTLIANKHR